ncbi:MAG: hypothetical protein ACXQTL_05990 [Methanosarcinales archaeon]
MNLAAERITIVSVTASENTQGWGTEISTSTSTTRGIVQLYSTYVEDRDLGLLERTDLEVYLSPEEEISETDLIKYQGKQYKILSLDRTEYYIRAVLKKEE